MEKHVLIQLTTMKMPFGKYKGTVLCDLPEFYLAWFQRKGCLRDKTQRINALAGTLEKEVILRLSSIIFHTKATGTQRKHKALNPTYTALRTSSFRSLKTPQIFQRCDRSHTARPTRAHLYQPVHKMVVRCYPGLRFEGRHSFYR